MYRIRECKTCFDTGYLHFVTYESVCELLQCNNNKFQTITD